MHNCIDTLERTTEPACIAHIADKVAQPRVAFRRKGLGHFVLLELIP
jgi:hypothetical protein